MNFEQLVQDLAKVRAKRDAALEALKELEAEAAALVEDKFGERLSKVHDNLLRLKSAEFDVYAALSEAAVAQFEENGLKQPHPAVKVAIYTTYTYDPDAALKYARKHIPSAVNLNKKAFEKAAADLELDFVTIGEEPRPRISQDLSAYLPEETS